MQCCAHSGQLSFWTVEPFVSRSFTTAAVECNFCHLLLCSNENECFPTGLATPLLLTVCKRVRCYKRIARIPCTHNNNSNNNTASKVILSWTNGAEHTSTGEKSERKNIGNADRTQYHQNTKQQKIRARVHTTTTAETETETETPATWAGTSEQNGTEQNQASTI